MSREFIKPYGDTLGDGMIQLSFTLPVENGVKAKKAAEIYAAKLNLKEISVVHAEKIADNFSYFVIFAKAQPLLDYSIVEASEAEFKEMSFYEINEMIEQKIKRPIVIVGASIGSDAHTVGIDAIMNMKGYNLDYGLERYPWINACNMGSQVSSEEMIQKALEINADAMLISQTVTQNECHIRNFTELIELLEAENLRECFIMIAGGARISNDFAIELGYDAGFGSATLPSHVASFTAEKLLMKLESKG